MDWDKRYEEHDTPWDKGTAAPVLSELLHDGSFSDLGAMSEVLVPGCGYGHDVRKIASAGYNVTGIDISERALQAARFLSEGEKGRAFFEREDLFDQSLPEKRRYDLVWEHTCYCAIDPERRADYVAAAYELLKPRGRLIGVFFTAPQRELGPPYMTDRDDLVAKFSKRFDLLWERAPALYYPAREGMEWLMSWQRRG